MNQKQVSKTKIRKEFFREFLSKGEIYSEFDVEYLDPYMKRKKN